MSRLGLPRAVLWGLAIAPAAIGGTAALLEQPWYQAQAQLLLPPGPALHQRAAAEMSRLRAESLLAAVVGDIGAQRLYRDLSESADRDAVARLAADLTLETDESVGVVRLRARNADPEIARMTLEALLRRDLAGAAEIDRSTSAPSADLARAEARVKDAETALARFGADHGIFDYAAQHAQLVRSRNELAAGQRDIEAQIETRRAELDSARGQLAAIPEVLAGAAGTPSDPVLTDARDALSTLEARRGELAARLASGSRDLAVLDAQISAVRSFLAETGGAAEPTRPMNPAYGPALVHVARLQADLAGLAARAAKIVEDLASIDDQLSMLDSFAPARARLEDSLRNAQDALRERLARDSDRASQPQPRILEHPAPSSRPESHALLYAAVGGALSLLALIGLGGSGRGWFSRTRRQSRRFA